MFKRLKRLFITLVVVAALLAIFKPSKDSFETWIKEKYATARATNQTENFIEKLVMKGSKALTEVQILSDYDYVDHYLVVRVDAYANGKKYRYLGIAKTWIQFPTVDAD